MPSARITIACAIDEAYLLPLAVMLESLRQHLQSRVHPEVYLIHRGIPSEKLAVIESIIDTRSIILGATQLAAAPHDTRFPPEAAIALLLADLLPPDLDRVLFLDADLLVLDDLLELWETPLDGRVLAAAPDGAVPLCSAARGVKNWQGLGIPAETPYFNGGVLLIDLYRWRERDVTRRANHYLETTRGPIDFLHQEALNAVLWNDWQPLDPRWNLLASHAGRRRERSDSQAWQRPGIVHFAGRMKPWKTAVGGPFNQPYQKVLAQVRPHFPPSAPTLREHLQSLYDRHLRAALYPFERYLWKQRLI